MDILLKNMEMPVDHGIFLVICPDGTIEQKVGNADNGYPIYNIVKDAKAVALPEHGELIDEDEFRLVIYREIRNHKEDEPITMILKGILWEMDNAPVIVEANNE